MKKEKLKVNNEQITSQNAITLIALIITIVILLILAAVTINLTMGENGIFKIAQDATIQYEIAEIKEQIMTEILGKQAENQGNISDESLKQILEKYGTLSEEENITDKTLILDKGNHKIKVSEMFNGTTVGDEKREPVITDKSGANTPNTSEIAKKTYVTWELNEAGTEYVINDTQIEMPDEWYDYENGKWANIKTTNKINETEILEAYWVWIPRYEYVVPTSATATEIEVKFISKDQTIPDKDYIIHPAFTNEGNGGFGELDGIWVAKFEASSNSPSLNYGGNAGTNLKVQIKPGVQSWRNIGISNIFIVCRKMTDDGGVLESSKVDSHMMKNTEWGAVAILSQSQYGVFNPKSSNNGIIWNNPNGYDQAKYIKTGFAGASDNASNDWNSTISPEDIIEYNKIDVAKNMNGTKASSTGTVYGIYDLASGSSEMVAGIMKNESGGLENLYLSTTLQTKPEDMLEEEFFKRYFDVYDYRKSSNDSNEDRYITGDATIETRKWNESSDSSFFVSGTMDVFSRGGQYNLVRSGVFAYNVTRWNGGLGTSFRPVLIPIR